MKALGACRTLVVGEVSDPHVEKVLGYLPTAGTVVVDGASIPSILAHRDERHWVLRDLTGRPVSVGDAARTRGWIRRYSPAGWDTGVKLGSHRAAVLSSRLSLLGALMRSHHAEWLSTCDRLTAAENKLLQYEAAYELEIRTPRTLISGDAGSVAATVGDPFIAKPLGVSQFDEGERSMVAFAQALGVEDIEGVDLLEAPFIMQERIHASCHLRVVTVRDQVWVSELSAEGLPVDWRREPVAHESFEVSDRWPDVAAAAARLAGSMGVGFTSQDWVVDSAGPCFLDLNPAGQWAFLPDPVPSAVAERIAGWLRGGDRGE